MPVLVGNSFRRSARVERTGSIEHVPPGFLARAGRTGTVTRVWPMTVTPATLILAVNRSPRPKAQDPPDEVN